MTDPYVPLLAVLPFFLSMVALAAFVLWVRSKRLPAPPLLGPAQQRALNKQKVALSALILQTLLFLFFHRPLIFCPEQVCVAGNLVLGTFLLIFIGTNAIQNRISVFIPRTILGAWATQGKSAVAVGVMVLIGVVLLWAVVIGMALQ